MPAHSQVPPRALADAERSNAATGGRLFVVAAPSGAGKTSLVNAVLEREPHLRVCVSHTTRKPRRHERSGREYHFVDESEFQRMVEAGEFLEWAQVFGNYYGTSRSALQAAFAEQCDVILEIDWQGAEQVRTAQPDCITVFVLPPSRAALAERLRGRRTEADAEIARRLAEAIVDIEHAREFEYVLINDQFERAVDDLQRILRGEAPDLGGPQRPAVQKLMAELLELP